MTTQAAPRFVTQTSEYDRLNGWLISGIIVSFGLFCVLLAMWAFGDKSPAAFFPPGEVTPSPKPEEPPMEDLALGADVLPELEVPQLAKLLPAVTDVVSPIVAENDGRTGDHIDSGKGLGRGDYRVPEIIPEKPHFKRWRTVFTANDVDDYKRQLDTFKIELGVVHSTQGDIQRISNLSGSPKVVASNRKAEKKSLYFVQTKLRFRNWDRAIANAANVNAQDAVIVQFYPQLLRQKMAELELAEVKKSKKTIKDVVNTQFKIERVGNGFNIVIDNVTYRK